MMKLPDVQSYPSEVAIGLSRVGVTNVKKLVKVERDNKRPIILISTFNMYVDLPSERKGANLSRNFEVIDEVIENAVKKPVFEIEDLCGEVAHRMLNRHEYATRAEVHMDSEYIVKRETPESKVFSQKVVKVFARAVAERNGQASAQEPGKEAEQLKVKKTIGAEVVGITACPCAQEIMKVSAAEELKKLGVEDEKITQFLGKIPMATHNQRGRGTLAVEVVGDYEIKLETIIDILERSMSAMSFELLKRGDEHMVVRNAHLNPKFVEDCVREMARLTIAGLPNLPDDAVITLKQVNEESIHQHNAFAELKTSMGRLRAEIGKS